MQNWWSDSEEARSSGSTIERGWRSRTPSRFESVGVPCRPCSDEGFTLIELMVVLLILAILLAIAIPTFLGVTKSANDRAAQSNLNTALVTAKSIFQTNSQSYALAGGVGAASLTANNAALVGSLTTSGTSLSFTTGTVSAGLAQSTISVGIAQDGNGVILASQAKGTNSCWYVIDNAVAESSGGTNYANVPSNAQAAGTWYGKYTSSPAPTSCTAVVPSGTVFHASGFAQ